MTRRIVRNPNIRFGKPTFEGTRLATEDVWNNRYAKAGDAYPQLTIDETYRAIAFERRPWRRLRRWVGEQLDYMWMWRS